LTISTKFRRASITSLPAILIMIFAGISNSQSTPSRVVSGVVTTDKNEVVPNVTIVIEFASGKKETLTDADGRFGLSVPNEPKRIKHGLDFNFAIDNLNNKRYWETQNYLESRVTPAADAKFRVHGTPAYPKSFTLGLTFRLGEK
jgi:outer membrane receptor protein involved in Fe transport